MRTVGFDSGMGGRTSPFRPPVGQLLAAALLGREAFPESALHNFRRRLLLCKFAARLSQLLPTHFFYVPAAEKGEGGAGGVRRHDKYKLRRLCTHVWVCARQVAGVVQQDAEYFAAKFLTLLHIKADIAVRSGHWPTTPL